MEATVSWFVIFFLILSFNLTLSSPSDVQTYIVHMSRSHKPTPFSSSHNWYSSIIDSLHPTPNITKLLYYYDHATTGFAAKLTNAEAATLSEKHGVLSVVLDKIRFLETTHSGHFLGLVDGVGLWGDAGNYGDGVVIGVLDTGIWPEHPSFSDSGLSEVPIHWKGECETSPDFPGSSCNKKLVGARAFFKGYVANEYIPSDEPTESFSPRDTDGHGTHTASIVAGSLIHNASFYEFTGGVARGIAHKARIAAYKVCWRLGCFDSDILEAMDQAIEDGVHIISLSIGKKAHSYDDDAIAIGALRASQHGIVVSCAAGNDGPDSSTVQNVAPWILTVGASTINREFAANIKLGNGRIYHGVTLYSSDPLIDLQLPLIHVGNCDSWSGYPWHLKPSKVKGKIVVCNREEINTQFEKSSAMILAKGFGMILANTTNSDEELITHQLRMIMVDRKAGKKINQYIKSDKHPTATILFRGTVIGKAHSPPRVAPFSGRGPNPLTPEILKPDVIAPGVHILAAWIGFLAHEYSNIDPKRIEFYVLSGTSMACPQVSGIAALLRNAYPNWSPAAIRSALITTASNLDNSGMSIKDCATNKKSTPFAHGAGHVDPNKSLDPGLVYDSSLSDYISFLCSIGYDYEQIQVFVRGEVSSDICHNKLDTPGNLNYPSFSIVFKSYNESITYRRTLKNVGRSIDAKYEVIVNAPANVDIKVSPSKLVFTEMNQMLSYEVTFSSNKRRWIYTSTSFGSISWTDETHVVRSPVVVTWKGVFSYILGN